MKPDRLDARRWAAVVAAAALGLICAPPAAAKDPEGLWYFGFTPGFLFTMDDARSNAALENRIRSLNDPRPDRFEDREISVEDGLSYGLTAGLGLTSLLSLQLDAGYFKGDVGPVDVYLTDTVPVISSFNPSSVARLDSRAMTVPVSAGEITEIPVLLSGVLRFRKDRPINPYLGVGFGRIFTGIERSEDVDRLNERLGALRIRAVLDEHGNELTPERYKGLKGQGKVPFTHTVTVDSEDSWEWHLTAGLEYFPQERFSVVAEARYMSTSSSVVIEMQGEDQVNFTVFSEKLFRKDGSLKFFNDVGRFPNPFIDPNDISKGIVKCTLNKRDDFDMDGHTDDLCYALVGTNATSPGGVLLVQGGEINLSGLTVQIGVRVWF